MPSSTEGGTEKIRKLLNDGVGAIYSEFVVGKDEADELGGEHDAAIAELDALIAERDALRDFAKVAASLRKSIGIDEKWTRYELERFDAALSNLDERLRKTLA